MSPHGSETNFLIWKTSNIWEFYWLLNGTELLYFFLHQKAEGSVINLEKANVWLHRLCKYGVSKSRELGSHVLTVWTSVLFLGKGWVSVQRRDHSSTQCSVGCVGLWCFMWAACFGQLSKPKYPRCAWRLWKCSQATASCLGSQSPCCSPLINVV